jgi:hypothetical protein
MCDNPAAIQNAKDANKSFSHIRHIDIPFHAIADDVRAGLVRVSHVSSEDNLSDILTKPLTGPRHGQLREAMGLTAGPPWRQ